MKCFQLLFSMCLIALAGCSSDSIEIDASADVFSIPDEFKESNVVWTKAATISESDTDRLKAYFQRNQSVTENPVVQGDPVVYTNASDARRYYWVCAGMAGAEWFCLEFAGKGVQVLNGDGEPFLADAEAMN